MLRKERVDFIEQLPERWGLYGSVSDAITELVAEAREYRAVYEHLVALTPGGSEFHEDPDACLRWLEARRGEVIEQVKRRKKVERQRDGLLALYRKVKDYLDHPEQTSNAAWSLIGLLENALEDADGED